jgi:cephalosporin hydroxylase
VEIGNREIIFKKMFNNLHKSYLDIFKNHTGFVSDKWIHYFFIYDQLFFRFRKPGRPITLLEIGVQNGGSLEIWKKYLPVNSRIYGIDIDEKCSDLKFSKNINFYLGSAVDNDFINKTFRDIEFDVILDDGSHICSETIKTFVNMFPKIKYGGMYIVEDMHTSYWKSYGGSFRGPGSSMEFFKGLTDTLNIDYLEDNGIIDEKEITFLKKYSEMICSISFFDSICAINKFYQKKTEHFQAVITGDIQPVADNSVRPKVTKKMEIIKIIKKLYSGS